MARYSGHTNSKSVNARLAEADGRFPASGMAAELRRRGLFRGVTAADIIAVVSTTEWHHVGAYAAKVSYYGLGEIFACRRELRAAIAARRAAPKAAPAERRLDGCTVEWLEWYGSMRRRRAETRRAEGVAVTLKGRWAILHLPGGDLRKATDTRGFTLRDATGAAP